MSTGSFPKSDPNDEKYYHPYEFIDQNFIQENKKILDKLRNSSFSSSSYKGNYPIKSQPSTISPLLIHTNPMLCSKCTASTSNVLKLLRKQNYSKPDYVLNTGLYSVSVPSSVYGKQELMFISKLCPDCQINWEFRSKTSDKKLLVLKKSDSRIGL
eukprot:NODE_107_length_19843_cov_0.502077.p13 type:complete len:156 gc:universal NODE_107_length_19843_cov_0.502077:13476-13943(+)